MVIVSLTNICELWYTNNCSSTNGIRVIGLEFETRPTCVGGEIVAGMILGAKFRSWANFPWFFQKQDSLF
jgi:hypothetical protein